MSVENVVLENENEIEPEGENRETPIEEREHSVSVHYFDEKSDKCAAKRTEVMGKEWEEAYSLPGFPVIPRQSWDLQESRTSCALQVVHSRQYTGFDAWGDKQDEQRESSSSEI